MNIYKLTAQSIDPAQEFWVVDIKWEAPQKMTFRELVLEIEDECFARNVFNLNTEFFLNEEDLND